VCHLHIDRKKRVLWLPEEQQTSYNAIDLLSLADSLVCLPFPLSKTNLCASGGNRLSQEGSKVFASHLVQMLHIHKSVMTGLGQVWDGMGSKNLKGCTFMAQQVKFSFSFSAQFLLHFAFVAPYLLYSRFSERREELK